MQLPYVENFCLVTHHWKCQLAKNKELSIPPICDCCVPTRDSFFTYRQIKHPPFSEIAVKTHSPFGPYLADYFACVPPALKKRWMFYLPMGKKWIPSRSSRTPDRWYWKFFIFGQLRLSLLHIKVPNCRLPKIHVGTKFMLCTYTYHMTH